MFFKGMTSAFYFLMMGLGYQTIQLISAGTSLEKILSLGIK